MDTRAIVRLGVHISNFIIRVVLKKKVKNKKFTPVEKAKEVRQEHIMFGLPHLEAGMIIRM